MPITGRHTLPIGVLFAASLLLLARPAAATSVKVQGRQLIVNGSTFTIQGVSYSPTPVGTQPTPSLNYSFWTDASQPYTTDFPLIKAMGANTIRVYSANQATKAVLDAAQSNGLYVIMGYPVTAADVVTSTSQTAAINGFTTMVQAWATHPAVLMWEFGNEVSTTSATTSFAPSSWYSFLNNAAASAKTAEIALTGTSHPVSTSNFDLVNIGLTASGADDAHMTSLDVWGVTAYRGSTLNCNGNVFVQFSTSSAKPMYVSEFGQVAFNSSTNEEDQTQQSMVISSQLSAIKANLSASSPSNVAIGGNIFEWTDEWWKSPNNTSDAVQDPSPGGTDQYDYLNTCYAQSQQFEEWWGIASIQSGTNSRRLRQVYYTLQSTWAPNNSSTLGDQPLITWIKNFPNPFVAGSGTRLQIQLSQPATLSVQIYDMSGHKVNELAGPPQDVGSNLMQYQWDGYTGGGSQAAAGLYIARVEASSSNQDVVQYRRIVIVK